MPIVARRYDTGRPIRLEITGERIAAIEPEPASAAIANLPWLAPALFDLQINGYGGQEFCSAALTTEHVATIVGQLNAQGVGRFLPTVTTSSFATIAHSLRTLAQTCATSPLLAYRIAGIHLEGPYISPEDGPRGAHPLEHCRPPDLGEFERWQQAAGGLIRLVTLSPHYDEAPRFIEHLVRQGVRVAIGHTHATTDQIRAAVDAGATLSTHLGNGAHAMLRRHPNYLWDQLAEDRLTASLIVDGHHLPPAVVKSLVRGKTPVRCVLVSDLSGLAGLPPGRYESQLCDLEILPDGRLVLAGQSQLLAGASRPLGNGVANVMRFAGLDLRTAIDMATRQPAELLGLEPVRLEVGALADLVLFDWADDPAAPPHLEVRKTIVRGQVLFEN